MQKRHQYQDAYDDSVKKFCHRKPQLMADLADAVWEDPFLKFDYLNSPVRVSWPTGEMLPNDFSLEEKIIIYQYLAESSNIPYTGTRWISFLELPEGQHHYQPFVKEAFTPLAQMFGENLNLFCRAGEKMGAIPVKGGDASFKIRVLPKISLMIMLWAKDDEFPARANILFDSQVSCHLSTATLYMLGIAVSRKFRA